MILRHIGHIYDAFGRLRRRIIIPVITCDEQMQSRCALLLAQVFHSRGVQVCLAMPDNVGAICLCLLTSPVLQRKESKRSVREAAGPRGNIKRKGGKMRKSHLKETNYFYWNLRFLQDGQRGMGCVVGLQNCPTLLNLYFLERTCRGSSESRHMAASD